MGFPITPELGKVTSWGTSEDVTTLLSAVRVMEFALTFDSDVQDVTGFGASGVTSAARIGGLRSGQFTFNALYPKAAPNLGDTSAVTFASGYVQVVRSWFIDIDFGEEDITSMPTISGGWRRFMPAGFPSWSGGWTAHLVSDTAASMPTAVNTAGSAATFKLKEAGATDGTWAGSVVVKSMNHSQNVQGRGKIPVTYTFDGDGDLTITAGTSGAPAILPAGVVGPSDWDTNGDGVPDVSAVLQTYTNRTYTGAAFLRSLRIEVDVDRVMRVSGVGRFSDAVTPA